MILTLQDDGVLRVYESVEDAVRDVEALDAEDTFQAVFDDTGEVYAIHWIRPNDRGRFLRFMWATASTRLFKRTGRTCPHFCGCFGKSS
jgi:hypothetical protein